MFRRKDELDMDHDHLEDVQGSLLSSETETVSVLSPQKAAEYQEQQKVAASGGGTTPTHASNTHGSGFSSSSASTFGQQTHARPIQPVSDASRPVNLSASNSNQSTQTASTPASAARASNDAQRFRQQEATRPAATAATTPTTTSSSSTFNSESRAMINKPNPNERVLTVGNDILLKGEITTCDRLVIEGKVDATVSEVHTMELAEAGTFKGTAEVEYAEISGAFEGNLIVRTSLVINRTGKVSGNITYGEIEIARGGAITGEIKTIAVKETASANKQEKAAA